MAINFVVRKSKPYEKHNLENPERGPAKKAGSVSFVQLSAFFWLIFFDQAKKEKINDVTLTTCELICNAKIF